MSVALLQGYTGLITHATAGQNSHYQSVDNVHTRRIPFPSAFICYLFCSFRLQTCKGKTVCLFICYSGVGFFLGQEALQGDLDKLEHWALIRVIKLNKACSALRTE